MRLFTHPGSLSTRAGRTRWRNRRLGLGWGILRPVWVRRILRANSHNRISHSTPRIVPPRRIAPTQRLRVTNGTSWRRPLRATWTPPPAQKRGSIRRPLCAPARCGGEKKRRSRAPGRRRLATTRASRAPRHSRRRARSHARPPHHPPPTVPSPRHHMATASLARVAAASPLSRALARRPSPPRAARARGAASLAARPAASPLSRRGYIAGPRRGTGRGRGGGGARAPGAGGQVRSVRVRDEHGGAR